MLPWPVAAPVDGSPHSIRADAARSRGRRIRGEPVVVVLASRVISPRMCPFRQGWSCRQYRHGMRREALLPRKHTIHRSTATYPTPTVLASAPSTAPGFPLRDRRTANPPSTTSPLTPAECKTRHRSDLPHDEARTGVSRHSTNRTRISGSRRRHRQVVADRTGCSVAPCVSRFGTASRRT